jgi:hypothetical protein
MGNSCVVEVETANKNHLTLNFCKQCFKHIQKWHPKLSKKEVYEIIKGIYDEK